MKTWVSLCACIRGHCSLSQCLPLVCGSIGMLDLSILLTYWAATGRQKYPAMQPHHTIPYISDIGADDLKPLFIACSILSTAPFAVWYSTQRWRRVFREYPKPRRIIKAVVALNMLSAIVGSLALCLLAGFDIVGHKFIHDPLLLVFIVAYICFGVFTCIEYHGTGKLTVNEESSHLQPQIDRRDCFGSAITTRS
jgi:hypothetical protein